MQLPALEHAPTAAPSPQEARSEAAEPAIEANGRQENIPAPADAWQEVADEFLRRSAERAPLLRSRSASPQRLRQAPQPPPRQTAATRRRRPMLREETHAPLAQHPSPCGFRADAWQGDRQPQQREARASLFGDAATAEADYGTVPQHRTVLGSGAQIGEREAELCREQRGIVQRWLHSASGCDNGSGGDRIPAAWPLPAAPDRHRRPDIKAEPFSTRQCAGYTDRRQETFGRDVTGGRSPRRGMEGRDGLGASISPVRHRSVSPDVARRGVRMSAQEGPRREGGRAHSASPPSARSAPRQLPRKSAVPASAEAAARQLRASYAEWQSATRRLVAVGHRATRHRRWKTCSRAFQVCHGRCSLCCLIV